MSLKLSKLLLTTALIILFTSGCKSGNILKSEPVKTDDTEKKVTIVTSFYPVYILTLNIVKDIPDVKVVNMTKEQTGCLHDYQLTTDDIKTLEKAQIFVINGVDMEAFMDKVVEQQPNLKVVDSSIGIEFIKNQSDGENNPHLWVSISNAIKQVRNIGQQLSVLDPVNAVKYKSNTDMYMSKLEAEKEKMHKELENIKSRDIITFHEAFPYFAKEFDLNIVTIIEREPGSEPSAGELAQIVKRVNETKVKALFAEPQYSTRAVETIARETGAKIFMLDPVVTGPPDADAYINIMDNNLKILLEALK